MIALEKELLGGRGYYKKGDYGKLYGYLTHFYDEIFPSASFRRRFIGADGFFGRAGGGGVGF